MAKVDSVAMKVDFVPKDLDLAMLEVDSAQWRSIWRRGGLIWWPETSIWQRWRSLRPHEFARGQASLAQPGKLAGQSGEAMSYQIAHLAREARLGKWLARDPDGPIRFMRVVALLLLSSTTETRDSHIWITCVILLIP